MSVVNPDVDGLHSTILSQEPSRGMKITRCSCREQRLSVRNVVVI